MNNTNNSDKYHEKVEFSILLFAGETGSNCRVTYWVWYAGSLDASFALMLRNEDNEDTVLLEDDLSSEKKWKFVSLFSYDLMFNF